jgi:polyprenyl-phospho-N-acetylgalactosaminyl synthase
LDKEILNATWVVMPMYNEGSVIYGVVREVMRAFPNLVVVDDGSSDNGLEQAARAGATVLRHPINLGQGAALQTGISYALQQGARYLVTFDADGQHQIRDVFAMLEMIRQRNLDAVLGSRFIGQTVGMSLGRRLLLRAAVIFTKISTGLNLTDAHNGLRVFTRDAALKINIQQNRMAHASEILKQISSNKMKYAEFGNTICYTDYSKAKGQKASNALNIVIDLMVGRLGK